MKQEAYDTRQRANDLLNEIVNIWRQSDHADQLEGIEQDPVFRLLVTALAYQANENDSEIERLKQDVLDEYARIAMPYEVGHAIPATAIIEAGLQSNIPETTVTEQSTFFLTETGFQFMPLFRSRIINANIGSVVRLDGRRWKVTLNFREPITDLSQMTFAIKDLRFQDVRISIEGRPLPLIKPWQNGDLPMQNCFSVEALMYNSGQMYNATMTGLDLYARQNVALVFVKKHEARKYIPMETESLDMVFDFAGIAPDFVFDKSHLSLNAILLVNAQLNTVTLSSSSPIVRVTGFSEAEPAQQKNRQFMHLLPPAKEQLFGKTPIEVRRVAADRFNQATLLRLINSLATKFHSDYYAFQELKDISLQNISVNVQKVLTKLSEAVRQDKFRTNPGIYMMLDRRVLGNKNLSLDVGYLTTDGSSVNKLLKNDTIFTPPAEFDAKSIRQIAEPVTGFDEVNNAEGVKSLLRYQMVTNDRIVTPADMKIFCYTELMNRYAIVPDMISNISIDHIQQNSPSGFGYAFYVEITLMENPFVKRNFSDKIPQAEMLLRKMMEVRSPNVYPIYVSIQMEIKKEKPNDIY